MDASRTLLLLFILLADILSVPTSASKIHELKRETDNSDLHQPRSKRAVTIPTSFDARTKWPQCPYIGHVTDHENCLSSWAIAPVAAISDRICIATNGKRKPMLSFQEILECCPDCGSCFGGQSPKVWNYWVKHGIPTGGGYNSSYGCKPYETDSLPQIGKCRRGCAAGYLGNYRKERRENKGIVAYTLGEKNIREMQEDMMAYGPVVAGITIYLDFFSFVGRGVYKRAGGRQILYGMHHVKIIGWGVQGGVDYWICTNSMGTAWGDKGLFKIRRGKNEMLIESLSLSAGLPALEVPNDQIISRCAQPTDLVFIVDSASADVFTRNVVRNMVSYINIGARYQVAIVLCSNDVKVTLNLGVEQNRTSLMDDISSYVYQMGAAPIRLDLCLNVASDIFKSNGRAEAFKLVIFLTRSQVEESRSREAAAKAKSRGIWITAMAEDSTQKDFIMRISSAGFFSFVTSGRSQRLPEINMFYKLPMLIEEVCTKTQICWECMFNNGVYVQEINGHCDMYYHCRRPDDTHPKRKRCPLGKFWNQEDLSCGWPQDTTCFSDQCWAGEVKFWPNPNHCGAYWECKNGRTDQLLCCPKFESWDQSSEKCVTNSSCHSDEYCFRQRGCNQEFYLTFAGGRLTDVVNHVYIDRNTVKAIADDKAEDGWAAKFNGKSYLTIRYYANKVLGKNIQIYVRFRTDTKAVVTPGIVEILVTNGGCVPIEPSFFIGYERGASKAHAYLRTEDAEKEISLNIPTTSGYIDLWYLYDGETLSLESEDKDKNSLKSSIPATGKIKKTHNALKIGSSAYPYYGHVAFTGNIDKVWVSSCEKYSRPTE